MRGRRAMALAIALAAASTGPGFAAEPAAAKAAPAKTGNPVVTISTSKGDIKAELYADRAPVSTRNFLEYARSGYYDGTVFHRVISDFMIQGGGMDAELNPKPGQKAPIENEATNGLENERGTLAMARLRAPNSATSQFFINVADNDFLDHRDETPAGYGYAVFGRVTEGMEVVDAIKDVPTGSRDMYQDVPLEPVTIESVKVEE